MAAKIATLFANGQTIADIVKSFDFSKISTTDVTRDDYLHEGLAPSFGTLNAQSIKTMDDQLKIMISGTMRVLTKVPPEQRSWDKVQEVLMQNTLIEPMGDGVVKADKIIKSATNVFKVDGSPDNSIVKEVASWFSALIGDEDVLKSTAIDINVLGRIVAQTGATVTSFETVFVKHEYHEKTMVDIGVLRYPDPDHPYFKVYRIQLTAWSDCSRVLFVQEDKNGITGEYSVRKFQPRASVIKDLAPAVHDQAVNEANAIFG